MFHEEQNWLALQLRRLKPPLCSLSVLAYKLQEVPDVTAATTSSGKDLFIGELKAPWVEDHKLSLALSDNNEAHFRHILAKSSANGQTMRDVRSHSMPWVIPISSISSMWQVRPTGRRRNEAIWLPTKDKEVFVCFETWHSESGDELYGMNAMTNAAETFMTFSIGARIYQRFKEW
ncbi:hypothetical protein BO78DRAFT_422017 [Aspergillus sclerotiicarbonarius CBS 121057]|uniref:Uncharacterized protein n=1 Tax=Aspergillus sclerotiicarbonarius (strain CBS 121057 / IBT 28362) TaxID=1448318 RepID=A0A319E454_ASPSB|nr:hypothetical protein BO78DRAFT_422017 [Aspergillus sclerotiicarbonarius CBS 121057]